MVGLIGSIPALHDALSGARHNDLARVDEGLRGFGVTGVHGEPEVGVTSVVAGAIGRRSCIRVDLDGAASEGDVAAMLARGLAQTLIGRRDFSLLAAPAVAPTSVHRAYIDFAERAGERVAAFAVADRPTDVIDVSEVLDAIERVHRGNADSPILWIDHLQAPLLTPRHPVDVDALLWNVRSLHQRTGLPVVLSGSMAATRIAYGSQGAFYGDGIWVTLGRPGMDVWLDVARAPLGNPPPPGWVAEMADITHGHPATMLLALALRDELPQFARTPVELWQLMLALDDGLVARAVQHARSLHRLGSVVLERIAHGARPYEGARTKAEQNDRNRALRRLYEGGLITQPGPRSWEVTNPLLAGRVVLNHSR
jgi:hypothetical protein